MEASAALLLVVPLAALATAVVRDLRYSLASLTIHSTLCVVAPTLGEALPIPSLIFSVAAVTATFAVALKVLPSYEVEQPVAGSWVLVVFAAVPVVWSYVANIPPAFLPIVVSASISVYMLSVRRNLVKASYGLVALQNSMHALLSQIVHPTLALETPLSAVVFLTALLSSVLALLVYKTVGSLDTSSLRRLEW